jgi:TRAP-type C4-dicarboxylate transport system substrate-binding protein
LTGYNHVQYPWSEAVCYTLRVHFLGDAMSKRSLAVILGAAMALSSLLISSEASAQEVISIGTTAPKKSTWGKVLRAWARAIEKKGGGRLELKFYFNAVQGDEGAMVAKIKSGQLDGALLTSAGLGKVYLPIIALEMPGLFSDWGSLDKAREELAPQFDAGAKAAGFIIAAYTDVGMVRVFSKGKAIRRPADLKTMKVYRNENDPVGPITSSVIGYRGVPSSPAELNAALSSGRINALSATALNVIQLQLWTHIDHVSNEVTGIAVGGLVFSKDRIDRLPADLRKMLLRMGKKAGKMLTKRIRREDAKAFKMLKTRLTLVTLTAEEKDVWEKSFADIRKRLAKGVFSAPLVHKLEGLKSR